MMEQSIQVSGIKKSSQSSEHHTALVHVRPSSHNHHDPQILYSYYPGNTFPDGGRVWNVHESQSNNRSYYVRRSDGQPVRVKKRVKVDVDGNLDVDGNIRCSQITALTSNNRANGLTVTSEGYVGIGTSNPSYPLHVTSMNETDIS